MLVVTDELGSLSSGRIIIADSKVSPRITFGFSGASGWVPFNAMIVVVLVASSSNILICWIKSLCEHGKGSGAYLETGYNHVLTLT